MAILALGLVLGLVDVSAGVFGLLDSSTENWVLPPLFWLLNGVGLMLLAIYTLKLWDTLSSNHVYNLVFFASVVDTR